jgi:transcriptional regulator with XRE-family HTH domain
MSTLSDLTHEPASNLQQLRRHLGATQSEVAAALSADGGGRVDRSTISRLERLNRNPSDALRKRLSAVFDLGPGEELL